MKIYACCVGLLLWVQAPSFAQCPLAPNSQFKPFSRGEDKPAGHFEWYSAAGPNPTQGGGHPRHLFERRVTNEGSSTLKYTWPIGRMHNDALPAGHTDPFCYEFGWPNQDGGPLNYGRGNDKTDTTVWEGKDEPRTGTIVTAFTFNISE